MRTVMRRAVPLLLILIADVFSAFVPETDRTPYVDI